MIPVGFGVVRSGGEQEWAVCLLAAGEIDQEVSHWVAEQPSPPGSQGAPGEAGDTAAFGGREGAILKGCLLHFQCQRMGGGDTARRDAGIDINPQRLINAALMPWLSRRRGGCGQGFENRDVSIQGWHG